MKDKYVIRKAALTVAALLVFVTSGSNATMHLKVPPVVGTSDNTIYIDDSYI